MSDTPNGDPITWILWQIAQDPGTWEPKLEAAIRGMQGFPTATPAGLPKWSVVTFSDGKTWPYLKP